MDVIEAMKTRYSVRAYKPDPVRKDVIVDILEAAVRAPSWGNAQTWEFAVVGGEVMQELKRIMAAKALASDERYPDIPRPASFSPYKERSRENGLRLYRLLDIASEDMEGKLSWFVEMYSFFNAPVGIVVYTERKLGEWALLNIGLVVQNIALGAVNYRLGTAILGAPVSYPGEIRQLLGIPESKQLVIALALGYPDEDAKPNQFRSKRVPLDEVVTWHGF